MIYTESYVDRLKISINRALKKTILLKKEKLSRRASGNVGILSLTVDFRKGEEELFNDLKKAYLEWRNRLGESAITCNVTGGTDKQSSDAEHKTKKVCEYWNQDKELISLSPIRLKFTVEAAFKPWIGFTSTTGPGMYGELNSTMRIFDAKQDTAAAMQALMARGKDAEERLAREILEAKKRNAERARNPIALPGSIAKEIAEYLRLEYGESWWQKGALRASNLKFVGEYIIDGVATQYWSYPTSTGVEWATVERFDDGYCLGMTSAPPPEGRNI